MSKSNVTISNPCHQSRDGMTQESGGKYCGSCKKIVVDFTGMTDEEIIKYLSERKAERTCGYFNNEQVTIKRPRLHEYLIGLHEGLQKRTGAAAFKKLALSIVTFSMIIVGCNRPKQTTPNTVKTTGKVSHSSIHNGCNTTDDKTGQSGHDSGTSSINKTERGQHSINNGQKFMGEVAPPHIPHKGDNKSQN